MRFQFLNRIPFQLNLMNRCIGKTQDVAQCSGIKGFKGSLKLKEGAKPVFMKDRPVPYSLVEKVEKEYDRLVESDILYPVSSSNWASPVVDVPKSDGSIRVCGDYKAII